MADFVAVLKKTIDGLGETNPDIRKKVYDKARATITAKLGQINPPPPAAVIERQKKALEDAIVQVEAEHKAAEARKADAADDLESIFASLSEPKRPPDDLAIVPSTLRTAEPVRADALPLAPATVATARPAPDFPEPDPVAARPPVEEPGYFDEPSAPPVRPRRRTGRVVALLVLLVLVAGGAAAWINREQLSARLGVELPEFAREQTNAPPKAPPAKKKNAAADTPAEQPKKSAAAPAADKPAQSAAAPNAATPSGPQKFTQRLAPDGTETDPGPAGGENKVGEGTSVAAATQAAGAPPAEGASTQEAGSGKGQSTPASSPAQVPVGQRAIFYEERTSTEQGSADPGSIVWSLVKESPGNDLPPEPAIHAEATIPDKNLQLRMTIRRNADKTLPASHIVELIFLTPENFEGGGIDSVLRVAMKDSEQAPGSPLIGIPAKIADGFFLLALNDGKAEIDTNMTLLRRESWIDIPVVYKSGRRALITLEKGIPGDKIFDEALQAWQEPAPAEEPQETTSPPPTPPADQDATKG